MESLFYMGCGMTGAALVMVLALLVKWRGRYDWRRRKMIDPADEGWTVQGERLVHSSGMFFQKGGLYAGKETSVRLLQDGEWYAREVMQHVAKRAVVRRALQAIEGLEATQTMKVIGLDRQNFDKTLRLTLAALDGVHGRVTMLLPNEQEAEWSVGDVAEVTVRAVTT